MYQVKVSVDEQRSYVSFYEGDTLLYRTIVESPYHITEQDPLVQRKKFKDHRTVVPPQHTVWVPGKINVHPWFNNLFKQVDKLVSYMPFRDKEIEYSIHTPFSNHVTNERYKVTEGFKTEELKDGPYALPTRAIKSITTQFGPYPLVPAQDATWKINIRTAQACKNVIYLRAHYSHKHVLSFVADLLKRNGCAVKLRPSFTMQKQKLEICPSSRYFGLEREEWASLDIYLQNPNAYRKPWWQKWFKKEGNKEGYVDSIWSYFKR
ncbi:hypothetical protein [Candidatus Avelusimicrobium luingense]|uniref:hypothetical protein n=1 Tax=Candidatus Avelusimicrobium luingense TaxID=3416211 RepID=UPI003D1236BC